MGYVAACITDPFERRASRNLAVDSQVDGQSESSATARAAEWDATEQNFSSGGAAGAGCGVNNHRFQCGTCNQSWYGSPVSIRRYEAKELRKIRKWLAKKPGEDAIVYITLASPVVPSRLWVYSTKRVYLECPAPYMSVFSNGVLEPRMRWITIHLSPGFWPPRYMDDIGGERALHAHVFGMIKDAIGSDLNGGDAL